MDKVQNLNWGFQDDHKQNSTDYLYNRIAQLGTRRSFLIWCGCLDMWWCGNYFSKDHIRCRGSRGNMVYFASLPQRWGGHHPRQRTSPPCIKALGYKSLIASNSYHTGEVIFLSASLVPYWRGCFKCFSASEAASFIVRNISARLNSIKSPITFAYFSSWAYYENKYPE